MFEGVGAGELFEEFGDYAFGTDGTAVDGAVSPACGSQKARTRASSRSFSIVALLT